MKLTNYHPNEENTSPVSDTFHKPSNRKRARGWNSYLMDMRMDVDDYHCYSDDDDYHPSKKNDYSCIEDDIPDTEFDEVNYYPFKEDTHRDSHTFRKRTMWNSYWLTRDMNVEAYRPYCTEGIPVTQIDQQFGMNISSLNKKHLYDDFVEMIEDIAVSKVETTHKKNNHLLVKYQVPIIGYMSVNKPARTDYYQHFDQDLTCYAKPRARIITIGGRSYSNLDYYQESGGNYVRMNVPKNWFLGDCEPKYEDNERPFLASKVSTSKSHVDFKYNKEVTIDSLYLSPTPLRFKSVHGDNMKCSSYCNKTRHTIQVLNSKSGFISRFSLYYRSSNTDHKWIKHGTYNGNSNIYQGTKIKIDPVIVKELRLVPENFHNSWDKIKFWAIGKVEKKPVVSQDILVEYSLYIPMSHKVGKVMDTYHYPDTDSYHYNDSYIRGMHKASKELPIKNEINEPYWDDDGYDY